MILAMDSSGSMTATDVAPDRMTAARAAASSFVENLPEGFRVGVVSFSNEADVVVPPTADRDEALRGLSALRADNGTALGDAIARSRRPRRHEPRRGAGRREGGRQARSSSSSSRTARTRPATTSRSRRRRRPSDAGCRSTRSRSAPTKAQCRARTATAAMRTIRVPPDPETLGKVAEMTGGKFFEAADRTR